MQLDYSLSMPEGYEGLTVSTLPSAIKTGSAEVAIGFGRGVVQGATDDAVKIPTDASQVFLGVAKHTHKMKSSDGVARYEINDAVPYQTKGKIMVHATVAVNKNQPAYLIVSGDDAGRFTNVSTGAINTKCTFSKSTSAAGLTVLELNLPQA